MRRALCSRADAIGPELCASHDLRNMVAPLSITGGLPRRLEPPVVVPQDPDRHVVSLGNGHQRGLRIGRLTGEGRLGLMRHPLDAIAHLGLGHGGRRAVPTRDA